MQCLTLCLVLHLLHVLHLAVDELGDERDAVLLRGEGGAGVRGQLGRLGHLLTTPSLTSLEAHTEHLLTSVGQNLKNLQLYVISQGFVCVAGLYVGLLFPRQVVLWSVIG